MKKEEAAVGNMNDELSVMEKAMEYFKKQRITTPDIPLSPEGEALIAGYLHPTRYGLLKKIQEHNAIKNGRYVRRSRR